MFFSASRRRSKEAPFSASTTSLASSFAEARQVSEANGRDRRGGIEHFLDDAGKSVHGPRFRPVAAADGCADQ